MNSFINDLQRELGKKHINFDAETMNGVTYEDCDYIAQSRGFLLSDTSADSGFTTHLYCFPNAEEHCLDAYSEDATFRCHVKKSKKDEAFMIYDGGYFRLNSEFIDSLKI